MIESNIKAIFTFIAVDLNDASKLSIDEFISDYQEIKPIDLFWCIYVSNVWIDICRYNEG